MDLVTHLESYRSNTFVTSTREMINHSKNLIIKGETAYDILKNEMSPQNKQWAEKGDFENYKKGILKHRALLYLVFNDWAEKETSQFKDDPIALYEWGSQNKWLNFRYTSLSISYNLKIQDGSTETLNFIPAYVSLFKDLWIPESGIAFDAQEIKNWGELGSPNQVSLKKKHPKCKLITTGVGIKPVAVSDINKNTVVDWLLPLFGDEI